MSVPVLGFLDSGQSTTWLADHREHRQCITLCGKRLPFSFTPSSSLRRQPGKDDLPKFIQGVGDQIPCSLNLLPYTPRASRACLSSKMTEVCLAFIPTDVLKLKQCSCLPGLFPMLLIGCPATGPLI